MATLKTNYKDDILNTAMNNKRRYTEEINPDGTKSFTDATQYSQVGDQFGASDINNTNTEVNRVADELLDAKNDITQISNDLTAPAEQNTAFIFDYKNGSFGYNTDPSRGADTFHPFSGFEGAGIFRYMNTPSVNWQRIGINRDLEAVASVGTTAGHSDYDNVYPWSEMTRVTLSTGDVMVKIPKFYFRRYIDRDCEFIQISQSKNTCPKDFQLHPAFNHGGVETDCIYVGAYKTTSSHYSKSGLAPLVSLTRAGFRNGARAKGTGWSMIDISARSAITMLYLVEFASNNAQANIGRGWCDGNSGALNTGSCDSVPNRTGRPSGTDGKTGVVYRGIEDFWGNIWEFVDGLNFNNGQYWVCNDITKYADDTTSNYTQLSYTGATGWSTSYISQEGLDSNNSHVFMPQIASGAGENTYYTDAVWSSTGWRVLLSGGSWSVGSACGVFAANVHDASSGSAASVGSRLLYIPS